MQFVQGMLVLAVVAASLWLLAAEGFVSAAIFFVFGLAVAGALGFALQIGVAAGGFIDRFIRHFGRR